MVETIEARDGRRLEVFIEGPEDGIALIGHHGTPSSGMLYPPHVAEASERGLRYGEILDELIAAGRARLNSAGA